VHLLSIPLLVLLLGAPPTPTEAVGGYGNGCLVGGVEVASAGVGFETIRRHRRRYFAHPSLRAFIEGFGRRLTENALPAVLVGDTAQAGGGRMPSGHRSHQTGLDADFWFTRPTTRGADRHFGRLVDRDSETIDAEVWSDDHPRLIRLAAEDASVARIFVHWVIKRELCRTATGDREWLRKVRPWWGHDRHFHVRLRCPPGSPDCRNQPEPTADECGREGWFSKAEVAKRKAAGKKPAKRRRRPLHPRCRKRPK